MKIMIDIPDEAVKTDNIANDCITYFECCTPKLFETLKNGTPLPEHHGRLIDADALLQEHRDIDAYPFPSTTIQNAPTIIEADKEDNR